MPRDGSLSEFMQPATWGKKHQENYISISLHLVQNRKENCHHDHIQFNVKGNGNIVFSVYFTPCRGLQKCRD